MHNKSLVCFFALVLIATVGDADANQTGWWHICNHCNSENQFRLAALNAPASDGIIFVSNANSLESRKFERFTYYEDFSSGVVQIRDVTPIVLSSQESQILGQALENGETVITIRPRSDFSFWDFNDYVPQSVLYEIQSGYLDTAVLNSAITQLQTESYFPSANTISGGLSVDIYGISFEGQGTGSRFRHAPLRVVINYADGSQIDFFISADGSNYYNISVNDKDGKDVPIVNPNGPVFQVNGPVFDGRTFNFGPELDSARQNFGNWLNTSTTGSALDCAVTTTDAGIRVTCIRSD